MFTYEEVMDYCSKYKIENGKVFSKTTNQEILDEDTILKVKSAILLYREANGRYHKDMQQFGKTSRTQQDYMKTTMERFGVNNEKNSYAINKLIHAILTSNGHCEEYMLGDELQNSKFSILIQPKYEYTMAYLKLKFREQGLDIEDLTVNQDLSRFKKDGISKIIIDYKIKKYEKSEERKTESASNNALYQHPKAKELNDLEKQKKLAKENNDMVAYQSAQAEIRRIIQKTRAELSLQQEDSMSIDEIIAFIKVKMNEAKVLNDKDEYNYWKANLKSLEEQKVQTVEVLQVNSETKDEEMLKSEKSEERKTKQPANQNNVTINKTGLDLSGIINTLKRELSTIQNAYKQITFIGVDKDIELRELKKLEGLLDQINKTLNNSQQAMNLATSEKDKEELSKIINILKEQQTKMVMLEKDYLSKIIVIFKRKLITTQDKYQQLVSNKHIDESELTKLIKQIKEILSKSYSLRNLVTDKEDKIAISKMINTLEEQQSKLVKLNNNLPEIQKQQNNHEEGLDLSGIINTLKRELIKIQNTYRDMMSDKVLDDEEFETLLNMVGKVLGNCYTAKSLATSEKDKKAILIIMNSLEELRTKMVKIQQYMQMKL